MKCKYKRRVLAIVLFLLICFSACGDPVPSDEQSSKPVAATNQPITTDLPTVTPTVTPSALPTSVPKPVEVIPVIIIPGIIATEIYDSTGDVWPPVDLSTDTDNLDLEKILTLMGTFSKNINKLTLDNDTTSRYELEVRQYDPIGSSNGNIGTNNTYGKLASALCKEVGEDNVFFFGYDWRMDIYGTGEKLSVYIDDVLKKTGCTQVDIVAHSMGGLVITAYLDYCNDKSADDHVNTVITCAAPFYGSENASAVLDGDMDSFDYLLQSINMPEDNAAMNIYISQVFNQLSKCGRTLPSVYSLVPKESREAVRSDTAACTKGFATCDSIIDSLASAYSGVKHINIVGKSSDTLESRGENNVYADGDGTVTLKSATGTFESVTKEFSTDHSGIVTEDQCIKYILDGIA